MIIKISTIALILTLIFSSCSKVYLKTRKGKDIQLNSSNYEKIKGSYSNIPFDTSHSSRRLFSNFKIDTLYKKKPFNVDFTPINHKTLNLKLYNHNFIVDSIIVKGNIKEDIFKVKREYRTKFIAGPLLWIFAENINYIGLTKENNLVVLNSGGAGYMLLIIFPILLPVAGQFENEYLRTKLKTVD